MDSRTRFCQGYRIIECCTTGDTELVIGYHPRAPSPYVCWYCKGGQSYYWGYYCNSIEAAREKMDERYHPGNHMPHNSPTAQEWEAGAVMWHQDWWEEKQRKGGLWWKEAQGKCL